MDRSSLAGRISVPFDRDAPIPLAVCVSGVILLLVGTVLAVDVIRDGGSGLVAALDIVFFWIPGASFVYVGYWLPRSEIPDRHHPRIVAWTGGGVVVMYGFIALRDLHPAVTVEWSIGTQAIGLTLGSVIGLVMGIQRAKATVRTATLEDRTRELEANERELERQNAQLERFASVVSHDLRNPLSVARGNLELVRDDCDSDRLESIADAHARMEALIDDLLTLARQGESVESMQTVGLAEVSRLCWKQVSTGDATLSVEDAPPIVADRDRLRQLLENLFGNAIEHGAVDGASVAIRVGILDDGDGFYVADDGPGIPKGERDRVFESGYSTADSGTGFGLAIVAEIAGAHGWEVRAVEGPDGGARIEITGVEFA
ncbi:HAMP domain-containing sensor histidine kinase [Halorubrum sp. F4]|uniref:sensor histidine kinase n=1 Tax=Halorubrum sp. F4 TaxID=2989715 RepID=UPI00247FC64C|nr:ATP-binding protein [Halorubrum sp. F4]